MEQRIARYYKTNGKNTEYVKAEVYYALGGYNFFTYKNEPRGYWVSVSPVERSGGMESYVAFSGTKVIALECARKSQKRWEEAKEIFNEKIENMISNLGFDVDYSDYEEREW